MMMVNMGMAKVFICIFLSILFVSVAKGDETSTDKKATTDDVIMQLQQLMDMVEATPTPTKTPTPSATVKSSNKASTTVTPTPSVSLSMSPTPTIEASPEDTSSPAPSVSTTPSFSPEASVDPLPSNPDEQLPVNESIVALAIRNRVDWNNTSCPEFCTAIKEYPQPLRKSCDNENQVKGDAKCNMSKPMMFSQHAEDYFLYSRHFSRLDRPGIYVDIGASNPISFSNTYFMDRCLGWGGICFEANYNFFEPINRQRSCALVPTCVSAKDGERQSFVYSGPNSGILDTHHRGKSILDTRKIVENMRCESIQSELVRYGVKDIDYMSVNVEGGELNALKGIDWNKTRVKVISVFVSLDTEQDIDEFVTSKGFQTIDTKGSFNGLDGMSLDTSRRFYVHESGDFGQPW